MTSISQRIQEIWTVEPLATQILTISLEVRGILRHLNRHSKFNQLLVRFELIRVLGIHPLSMWNILLRSQVIWMVESLTIQFPIKSSELQQVSIVLHVKPWRTKRMTRKKIVQFPSYDLLDQFVLSLYPYYPKFFEQRLCPSRELFQHLPVKLKKNPWYNNAKVIPGKLPKQDL